MSHTVKRLRAGETVELDGLRLEMDSTPFVAGDLYVGERNTGPHLLTAAWFAFYQPHLEPKVRRESEACPAGEDNSCSWVHPVERAYPYDGYETVKVRQAG